MNHPFGLRPPVSRGSLATGALLLASTALLGCDPSVQYGQIPATEQEQAAEQSRRQQVSPPPVDAATIVDADRTTDNNPLSDSTARSPVTSGSLPPARGAQGAAALSRSPDLDAGTTSTSADAATPVVLPNNVTVWLAGDSTVSNGNTPCPRGWGGQFEQVFDERVQVVNSAAGGRSVRTWLYEVGETFDTDNECVLARDPDGQPIVQARWQAMLDNMKFGDFLLIQFGINDGDPSCNRHVGLAAFAESYGMMAAAAKQRGTQPVFITPASMVRCNGSSAVGSRGAFVPTTIQAGLDFDVPVIDLHRLSVDLFNELDFCPIAGGDVSADTTGPVGDFFCDDHTHFDQIGARRIAQVVAEAIAGSELSLKHYLR